MLTEHYRCFASTMQFSNNTHHHTATHPHPKRTVVRERRRAAANREDVSSQTPNSVPTKPHPPDKPASRQ